MADRPPPSVRARCREAWTRLGPRELKRRMVHMLPGLLPFVLWPIPHRDPLSLRLKSIMIVITISLSVWVWRKRPMYERSGERGLVSAVVGYAAIILATLLLVPASPELGLAVMGILAFGDGSATLFGILLGGRRLPWNPAKTWSGLAAFVACAIPMAAAIYWGEAQPRVSPAVALACVAPAAVVAALAESLPWRVNDNIRVGLAAAMTIIPLHVMFVGW